MRRALLVLVVLALVCAGVARAQAVDEAAALARAFPESSLEKRLVVFTAAERERIAPAAAPMEPPRTFRCWISSAQGRTNGYAVIADAPGKCQPITYLLATDAQLSIRSVEILAYRESRGGEVREERWRAQFVGKDATSELQLARDIRNVAGATISCRSITDSVRRDLASLRIVRDSAPGAQTADAAPPGLVEHAATPSVRCRLLMGTTLSIEVDASESGENEHAQAAIEAAFAEVARLEELLSDWKETSELRRFLRAPVNAWFDASPELGQVLQRSRELWRTTGGAFDPSVGALVRVWRAAAQRGVEPSSAELESASRARGLASFEIDPANSTRLRHTRDDVSLDFGAIGKGFALERAARELEARGVHRALLCFGGQLLALDPPARASGWAVELCDPAGASGARETRRVSRISISTSSDLERGYVLGARRVSHHVDPRSGLPVEGMLAAIVFHRSATDADALSTALFVLGAHDGELWAREHGVDAILWPSSGDCVRTGALARGAELHPQ